LTVLSITSGRRYAMRLPIGFRTGGARQVKGLLIEISQEGMRISNLGDRSYTVGEPVDLSLPDGHKMSGIIRWAHDGLAGVRLERALTLAELSAVLDNRPSATTPDVRLVRYGT